MMQPCPLCPTCHLFGCTCADPIPRAHGRRTGPGASPAHRAPRITAIRVVSAPLRGKHQGALTAVQSALTTDGQPKSVRCHCQGGAERDRHGCCASADLRPVSSQPASHPSAASSCPRRLASPPAASGTLRSTCTGSCEAAVSREPACEGENAPSVSNPPNAPLHNLTRCVLSCARSS